MHGFRVISRVGFDKNAKGENQHPKQNPAVDQHCLNWNGNMALDPGQQHDGCSRIYCRCLHPGFT